MALIPPNFLDAVVALEKRVCEPGQPDKYEAVASGVVVGHPIHIDDGKTTYRIFLITNRHVVHGDMQLFARFNRGDRSARFALPARRESGSPVWKGHAEFDIAVTPLNVVALREAGAELNFVPDDHLLDMEQMEDVGVSAGDSIFVLGFPMGLAGTERKFVVVRSGIVARLDSEIVAETQGFLIDSTVFPGNSGGLVLMRPEVIALSGTSPVATAYAIGIVSSYLPYTDVAISSQTRRPRIIFEENSGLASVVPLDAVKGAIQAWITQTTPEPGETSMAQGEVGTASTNSVETNSRRAAELKVTQGTNTPS